MFSIVFGFCRVLRRCYDTVRPEINLLLTQRQDAVGTDRVSVDTKEDVVWSQLVSQTVGGSVAWFTGIYQRRKLVVKMENHE